jgi:hypothetical protein
LEGWGWVQAFQCPRTSFPTPWGVLVAFDDGRDENPISVSRQILRILMRNESCVLTSVAFNTSSSTSALSRLYQTSETYRVPLWPTRFAVYASLHKVYSRTFILSAPHAPLVTGGALHLTRHGFSPYKTHHASPGALPPGITRPNRVFVRKYESPKKQETL